MTLDIRGFQETSFIDWDGVVCAVVYLPRCNFRCPFCHNAGLVENPEHFQPVSPERIGKYLLEHKDFIDGVCLTGGEPCASIELFHFMRQIKELGFKIKLDTNGYLPGCIKKAIDQKLVDYVAMDIKGPLNELYSRMAGVEIDINKIKESIRNIMNGGIDYEFRTTVVPTMLGEKEIAAVAQSLAGARKFVLQQFNPKETLDPEYAKIKPYGKEQINHFAEKAREYVANTVIRGI